MKFINKFLNKVRQFIIKYIYTNRLFLSYVILSFIGSIIIRDVTVGKAFSFFPLITDLALIIIIGALGYLIKPKNQFKYFMTWIIIFTILETINSVFYLFYEDFASFLQLSTIKQVETVADSIFVKLRIIDFVYLLQPFIFYYIHNNLKKSAYYNIMAKIERKKTMTICTLAVGIACLFISLSMASGTDYGRLAKQWNRPLNVERFGIFFYQFNDAFQTIMSNVNALFGKEDAVLLFNNYFDDENRETYSGKNKYTGILEGYNIVYIHMESMQNFLMDLKFNDVEVTPNLNKLASEGMFFSNFYPQIALGTSADAEYITLTGLLPSTGSPVFSTKAHNTFKSLPNFLKDEKGYYTFSMHGNLPGMWNRSNVHPYLGYIDMYYKDTFEFDDREGSNDVVGLGIKDELFFEQAITKLETIEDTYKNYFGTLITLSNHSPFDSNPNFTLDINDYFINEETLEETKTCYLCNRDIGKYIRSSHYADYALGKFLEAIKASDHFNNTIFVFYGDHDAKISYKDMNYLYNYDPATGDLKDELYPTYRAYDSFDHYLNKKTPLIIWTKNASLKNKFKGEVSTIMGMYDLAPTLYNMLNIQNKYVLGHDIFNIKDNNIVVFPSGNFLTSKIYHNSSTGEYKEIKSGVVLEEDYIAKNLEYVEKAIDVGNAIINYDLFADIVE